MYAKSVNVCRSAPFSLILFTKPPTIRTKRCATYTHNVNRGVVVPRLVVTTDRKSRNTRVVQSPGAWNCLDEVPAVRRLHSLVRYGRHHRSEAYVQCRMHVGTGRRVEFAMLQMTGWGRGWLW
jgi:hypothetical protein